MEYLVKQDTGKYIEVLEDYPYIREYLKNRKIKNLEKLDSLWRKENLLLKINCENQSYVFKKINSDEKCSEINRVLAMEKQYPGLVPAICMTEKDSYLMDYINGDSFFNLDKSQMLRKINFAGKTLARLYNTNEKNKDFRMIDISQEVFNSFNKYRKSRASFFSENELILPKSYFDIFNKVKDQLSHNDLNAANLLYEENSIKLIDPSDEGFDDCARDIGRYAASCFFNNYDYFGNNKEESIKIAESFLGNFQEDLLARAKYYIGESFLSFLKFDTVSVSKEKLKELCINTLLSKDSLVDILRRSL